MPRQFLLIRDTVPVMKVFSTTLIAALCVLGSSCKDRASSGEVGTFNMGERAQAGALIYTVVDSQWAISLGDGALARVPTNRFLTISLTVVNSGKDTYSVPAFTLIDDNGKTYQELDNGEGVPNWLGVIRAVQPAQSTQGTILFDVPQKQFKLRVGDDTDLKYGLIRIPLSLGDPALGKPVAPQPPPSSIKP